MRTKGRGGSQKSEYFVDVIYGWPLTQISGQRFALISGGKVANSVGFHSRSLLVDIDSELMLLIFQSWIYRA